MIRRKALAAMVAATVLAGVPTVNAAAESEHGSGHDHGTSTTTITTTIKTWQLLAANCSKVPAGTVIDGTGTLTDRFTQRTNKDGTTTLIFDDHADGTAVDQKGYVYRWRYDNHLEETNTLDAPAIFRGPTTDSFRLEGKGPLRVRNGFSATITDDYSNFPPDISTVFSNVKAYGDPFDFVNPANRCDPL